MTTMPGGIGIGMAIAIPSMLVPRLALSALPLGRRVASIAMPLIPRMLPVSAGAWLVPCAHASDR